MLAQTTLPANPASSGFWNTPVGWIVIAAIVIIVIAVVAAIARRSRSAQLEKHYGSEYERSVRRAGTVERGEADLARREARRKELAIAPLTPGARARYAEEWQAVQARFVDDPRAAVGEADRLLEAILRDRGYPRAEIDQTAEDLSVDHPSLATPYRSSREIAARAASANTEDLRQALVQYRAVIEELIGAPARPATGAVGGD